MKRENETPEQRLLRIKNDNVTSLKLCANLLRVNAALSAKVAMERLNAPDKETAEQGVVFAWMLLDAIAQRLETGEVIDPKGMTRQ